MNDRPDRWRLLRHQVEQALGARIPPPERPPGRLHEAMRYASLGGGKRLRAMLVYTTGELLRVAPSVLDVPACAVELIHAYSLVHDDLPAMDNDDLRRGRATCHRAFDEATAILAGDALQTLAFEILSSDPALEVTPDTRLRMIAMLTEASGASGMAGGQAIDLAAVGDALSLAELETMHRLKTGALIRASIALGALCAPEVDEPTLVALDNFGQSLGLAFQIVDDILDEVADTETLGKASGADRARNKPTYTSLQGVEQARASAATLQADALAQLATVSGETARLAELADFMVRRGH